MRSFARRPDSCLSAPSSSTTSFLSNTNHSFACHFVLFSLSFVHYDSNHHSLQFSLLSRSLSLSFSRERCFSLCFSSSFNVETEITSVSSTSWRHRKRRKTRHNIVHFLIIAIIRFASSFSIDELFSSIWQDQTQENRRVVLNESIFISLSLTIVDHAKARMNGIYRLLFLFSYIISGKQSLEFFFIRDCFILKSKCVLVICQVDLMII